MTVPTTEDDPRCNAEHDLPPDEWYIPGMPTIVRCILPKGHKRHHLYTHAWVDR